MRYLIEFCLGLFFAGFVCDVAGGRRLERDQELN